MGTGTSNGIPAITCHCAVCSSHYKKDKRLRTSAYIVAKDGTSIVIDTGPDFRIQALTYDICKLDALLITHSHADHLHGLDDVKVFSSSLVKKHAADPKMYSAQRHQTLKLYSNHQTILDIKSRFNYIFKQTQEGGGKPHLTLIDVGDYHEILSKKEYLKTFTIGCLQITPIPMKHGSLPVCGWKITDTYTKKTFGYLTDCNYIPHESIQCIKGADCIVIDALREKKHPTHCSFEESYQYVQQIRAKQSWVTHMSHAHGHKEIIAWFKNREKTDKKNNKKPIRCRPAWDGLSIKL
ncbi:MAG: hypothetical protein BKP49_06555 [Treponema sp. CETP13]|nr:MAG: hypothetical protein BKP49_06555 [Treponema sp. CETP13]